MIFFKFSFDPPDSLSEIIVRNFKILISFPSPPTRSYRKRTGPFELNFIMMAQINWIGEVIINPTREKTISNRRLIIFCPSIFFTMFSYNFFNCLDNVLNILQTHSRIYWQRNDSFKSIFSIRESTIKNIIISIIWMKM